MPTNINKKRSRQIFIHSLLFALVLGAMTFMPAYADDGRNCWGTVTAQRASTAHDIGEHSSAQSEPRLGLGNVTRLFGFDHVSELGSFLASLDGLDETQCP